MHQTRRKTISALTCATLLFIGETASARDVTVTMADMHYGAIPADLAVGDTITWVNNDTVAHTVTARDHSFDIHLGPHQSVKQPLDKAGTFAIFCIYHSMMRGTLKVGTKAA